MLFKYIGKKELLNDCRFLNSRCKNKSCQGHINGECPFIGEIPRHGFKKYFVFEDDEEFEYY